MFINCKVPLRQNEIYQISIRPPNRQDILLTCKVMWSNPYSIGGESAIYGMGFYFVEVTDEDRHLLSDLISLFHE
jgi:hypothetical protein